MTVGVSGAGLLALAIAACSGNDVILGPAKDGPVVFIGVGVSGAANITRGSTVQVTVTVTRLADFTGVVTLSAEGLPAGVTAAFAPPTLPNAAAAASTLTLSATTTATLGSVPATVRAKGKGVIDATVLLVVGVTP